MLSGFLNIFGINETLTYSDDLYNDLISQLGGRTFKNGIFNIFKKEDIPKWTEIIESAYPNFKNQFKPFGYDWLGRCFAINTKSNPETILFFEIGSGHALTIPCSFKDFLNNEIGENAEACLAVSFFVSWLQENQKAIPYGYCIGYKVPLFLSGEDALSNLEENDMDVYWHILGQILNQI